MTDRYAVIGNPIAHSRSPQIHAAFARQTGQDLRYDTLLGRDFRADVQSFFQQGGKGLNVTLPFKEDAYRLVDELSPEAQSAKAVNTLIPLANGCLRGENTDGIGLVRDLQRHDVDLADRRILLLGAGGAARGILRPLLEQRPAILVIANRTPEKALGLAAELAGFGPVSASGFGDIEAGFDLIINATSAGIADQMLAVPAQALATGGVCYDLMYARQATAFMRWGAGLGAAMVLDGLGMLVEQAAEAFYLWRGLRPDTLPVLELLKSS
jgi:shikimate dehydrogenase